MNIFKGNSKYKAFFANSGTLWHRPNAENTAPLSCNSF
ncbi:hypothetical protein CLV60_113236 [Dyadobacter jiangsuensis]|uniref:Uncharacterized protein n=1 Tax=Dyadobacter jiangsuensis TaxID=1591085 RepID=A0A2P8FSY0_9BACT|nr:hypothetical protein CLV60_113236 [Dyadobacter jiangsuensis]